MDAKRKKLVTAAAIAGAGWAVLSSLRRVRYRRSLRSKVALITGGSRGFGLALAEQFGRHGARLVLVARDAAELERARASLVRGGIPAEDVAAIPCDLTDSEQTQRMVAQATRGFGQIDILVNNAGIIMVGPVENQPLAAFKDAIASNYYTMLHATLATLPQMLERKEGSIVNITSIGGKMAVPHLLPYSAGKFAALGFSQGLHAEVRSKGIRVTTVCPGLMRTGSQTHALFTGNQEKEFRWFSLGASLPGVSSSASRAAKAVVDAAVNGDTEITITPQAAVAATVAQALPTITAAVMHWVNSLLLPGPVKHSGGLMRGDEVCGKEMRSLTKLGRKAARRYNELEPPRKELPKPEGSGVNV